MRINLVFLSLLFLLVAGCAKLTLAWADLSGDGAGARPPALAAFAGDPAIGDAEAWRARRAPLLKAALGEAVYGAFPSSAGASILAIETLDRAALSGKATFEAWRLQGKATFNGVENTSAPFVMNVLYPNDAAEPAPVILIESFCPRWDTMPHPKNPVPQDARTCRDGFIAPVIRYVFGRYIATPPLEEIVDRGYAIATIYPDEFLPDDAMAGQAALRALSEGYIDEETRWGSIAGWAWAFSRMVDALETDDRFAADGQIVYGHSRYGKSALLAAVHDPRIDGVIAHQSGTGGASLNRQKKGETVAQITEAFPHWFAQAYRGFAKATEAMDVDQHHLLALIAPRPVLLGNARRDVWSDPNGAFRAAQGADPVYELLGAEGLDQERLDEFKPEADIAFWIRPGTHGVVEEDWPAFLAFADAHFK
ncbi:MAG: alpha/beta hydrolase [Pseudomonadota bacterium]